jgi:hypothetical protein
MIEIKLNKNTEWNIPSLSNSVIKGSVLILVTILVLLSLLYLAGIFTFHNYYNHWIINYRKTPPLILFLCFFGYLIISYLTRKSRHQYLANLACSFILLVAYISFSIVKLGDYKEWIAIASGSDILYKSELLGNLTYNLAYNSGLKLYYIAPIFGGITCFVYLLLGKKIIFDKVKDSYNLYFLYKLNFLSAGFSMLYYLNYVENTMLSIPFGLLYIYYAAEYLEHQNKLSRLMVASFFLSIACLFHGQNTFLLPSLPFLILIGGLRNRNVKTILLHITASALVILSVVVVVLVILKAVGYQIESGNIYGGGDSQLFVPIFKKNATIIFTRFLMFSISHFMEISNIVLHASPATLILSALLLFNLAKRNKNYFKVNSVIVVTGITTLCYLAFIFLWNFDLGFPTDLDLMISLGFPLSIFTFSLILNISNNNKMLVFAGSIFCIFFNLIFISSFLTSRL